MDRGLIFIFLLFEIGNWINTRFKYSNISVLTQEQTVLKTISFQYAVRKDDFLVTLLI